MSKTLTIKNVVIAILLIIIGGSLITLLVAANKKSDAGVCNAVEIQIQPLAGTHYITEDEVLLTIEKVAGGTLVNRRVASLQLQQMEVALEKNNWISDAQLFLDGKNQLNVLVMERTPIARFINTAGISYYVDKEGFKLDFIEDKPVRLPVVTGISASKKWTSQDSVVFNQAVDIVNYINANPFWNAQVGQVDITQGKFSIIPVLGDGIISLGSGDNIDAKFQRLLMFYKQVLSKVGLNKYAAIDVQYDDQVVAVKKGKQSIVDSAGLKKNIELFLKEKQLQEEANAIELAINEKPSDDKAPIEKVNDPATDKNEKIAAAVSTVQPVKNVQTSEKPKPLHPSVLVKTISNPIEQQKKAAVVKKKTEDAGNANSRVMKQAKAVMPKKEEVENDY